MLPQFGHYLLALSFALGAGSNIFGQSPAFTTIEFPGSTSTVAWGINTRGDVVGIYTSASLNHGFLLRAAQFTSIDFPGASGTELYGINTQGDMVGVYTLAGTRRAFLLSGNQFTKIDFPDAVSTEASAINPRGDTVGFYVNADKSTHGFMLSAGQFTTIDFPGSTLTLLSGINPQGDIAGAYAGAGGNHGFRLSDGDFTSLDFPGATFTNTTGINPRGDIVGRYTTGGVTHGYLLSGGQFSTIDFAGATFTGATSIDPRGTILGRYRNADNIFHTFLLSGFRQACIVAGVPPQIAVTAGGPAVTHSSDFTLVTSSKPASAGEVLSIFAKDLGPTRPSVVTGQPFAAAPLAPVDSLVEVRVNGRSAVVFGAFGLPGTVNGYQVNFRMPADAVKGTSRIELSAGSIAGAAVNITVQ